MNRELVEEALGCPNCGNRDMDLLEWQDGLDPKDFESLIEPNDEMEIECLVCGTRYKLPE